jgi:hypothetical protein
MKHKPTPRFYCGKTVCRDMHSIQAHDCDPRCKGVRNGQECVWRLSCDRLDDYWFLIVENEQQQAEREVNG